MMKKKKKKEEKEKIRMFLSYVGHENELWLYCNDCAHEQFIFFASFFFLRLLLVNIGLVARERNTQLFLCLCLSLFIF